MSYEMASGVFVGVMGLLGLVALVGGVSASLESWRNVRTAKRVAELEDELAELRAKYDRTAEGQIEQLERQGRSYDAMFAGRNGGAA